MVRSMPGVAEIQQTVDALRSSRLGNVDIFPLHANLSASDQKKVFAKTVGRKIVVATNVVCMSSTHGTTVSDLCYAGRNVHYHIRGGLRYRLWSCQGDAIRLGDQYVKTCRVLHKVSCEIPQPTLYLRSCLALFHLVELPPSNGEVEPVESSQAYASSSSPGAQRRTAWPASQYLRSCARRWNR